jgi:hypothetical protein
LWLVTANQNDMQSVWEWPQWWSGEWMLIVICKYDDDQRGIN